MNMRVGGTGTKPEKRSAFQFFCHPTFFIAGLMLTGCGQNDVYTAPPNLTPQTAATIKGSHTSSLQVYLTQIDGKDVVGGWNNPNSYKLGWQPWEGIYLLSPGQHDIIVGAQCCTEGEFNFAPISMNFVAGTTYVLDATTPEAQSDGSLKTSILLKSDAGVPLSPEVPMDIKVNPSAGPVFIPIFVK